MSAYTSSWLYWSLLSAVFAALTALFAKIGVSQLDSDLATFLRTLVVVIMLVVIVTLRCKWQAFGTIPPAAYGALLLSGLGTGLSWICYFRALRLGNASRVAPIDKLSVVFVAIFSLVFLGERPGALNWLGIALITLGAVLVALRS